MSRRPWWRPRRSRRPQRWALLIVSVSVVGALWAARTAYQNVLTYPDRAGSGDGEELRVEIPRGSSFSVVLGLLAEHGVIADEEATAFKLFVLHHGAANKITAGRHVFRGDMTPTEILEELQRRQKIVEVNVTIPEGKHMLQVAQILEDAGLGEAKAFEAIMRDPVWLAEVGIDAGTAEGYLFPDTYKFRQGVAPEKILRRFARRHREVYEDLRSKHHAAVRRLEDGLGWGPHQIVTLASIVEKETGQALERPRIASVFFNRLQFERFKPKRLETDPTILYGCTVPVERSEACQSFEGRIRRIHLRDPDNAYNTYTHEGLPPGPIANPGRGALEAVLDPDRSRYLFFVARNDGTHQFSATRGEHEAAVDKYIRGNAVGDGTVDQD
jgi:UPF0755 protein